MSARELHVFYTPTLDEVEWAGQTTESDGSRLGLVLALKCFQRMGRFPKADEVPEVVVDHVRRCLDLGADVSPVYDSDRTQRHHRNLIRKRVGVTYNPARAHAVAATAIRDAAAVKNNPPDLINVALETLVAQSLELLGFTVLDKMVSKIRGEVNREIIAGVCGRISGVERAGLMATVQVPGTGGQSMFTRMKKPAKRPSWSRFREQSQYLGQVDELSDTGAWLDGVAESKIADFAAEAAAKSAGTLSDYDPVKQVALLACLVHTARARARDDLADMLCKRVAVVVKKAKAELDEIRLRQRAVTERLIVGYKSVLEQLTPDGVTTATEHAAASMAHEAPLKVAGKAGPDGETDGGSAVSRLAEAQGEALVSVLRALKIQGEGLGAIRTQVAGARGLGLSRRQSRDAGAAVLPQGPLGDVRPGRAPYVRGDLGRCQRARRRGPRAGALDADAGPHPRPRRHARRARRGGGHGDRHLVRVGELAEGDPGPRASREAGAAAFRGMRVHLPRRGAAHRRRGGVRRERVRELGGEPAVGQREPAREHRQVEQGDHRGGQRVRPPGRGQGLG